MKVESYQKIATKAKHIRELIGKPNISAGKIDDIKAKIDSITKNKDTHNQPVTLNISTTVIEVDPDTALVLLKNSLDAELRLVELYEWRMDKAISFLEGEYDDGFYNDK